VRPTVNSSGVLLEGELSTGAFLTTGVADTRYVATGATGSFLTTGVGDARYAFSSATGSFLTATTANALYVELADQPVYQTGTQTISGLKTFADVLNLTTQATASNHAVRADRNFSAGAGLLGGGDLTSNRTFSVDTSAVVTTVGTQTIAGVKTFTERPTVNSSGVLLIGDSATGAFLTTGAADLRYVATGATGSFLTTGAANLQYVEFDDLPVFQTGNQTISGVKTFATGLLVQGDIQATSITTSSITTNSATALSLQYAAAGHVAIHTKLNIVPSDGSISINNNTFLTSRGAANFRLGAADAAAPVAQTLSVQSVAAGMTNTAGANLTVTSSQGTGTGVGGSIIFQVAPAGTSGTSQNALIPRVIFPATSAGGVVIAFNALDSSNVALRSTGTTLDIVRADASSFASLTAQNITAQGTISTNNFAIISNVNVAATTGEQIAFITSTTSNGTAANGFGTRIALRTESSTTADRDSGAIAAVWSDATDATRTSDLLFYNALNGTLTERLRILGTNGNVGIGTGVPSEKLEVSGGNIKINGVNNASLTVNKQNAANNASIIFTEANVTKATIRTDTLGNFSIEGPNSVTTKLAAANSATLALVAGASSIITFSTNGFERMRTLSNGNVGIGTTTPTSNFQVTQSGTGEGVISVGAGGTTVSGIGTQFLNTFKVGDAITSAGQTLTISAIASDTSMTTSAAGAAISGAAYTLVGRNILGVKGNGRVGIGTIDPVTNLQINNKVGDAAGFVYDSNAVLITHQTPTATATLNDPKTVLVLARQGTSTQAYGAGAAFNLSRFENSGTNSRTRLDISLANNSFDLNSNTVITMLSNGNVGIGRTAPLAKLDVNGTAFINATSDGGTGATLTVGGTGSTIYTPGSVWATGGLVLSGGNNVSQVTVNGSNIVNISNGGLQLAGGGPVLSYVSSTGIKVLQANGITYGSVNAGTLALGLTYAGVAAPANGAIIEGKVGIGTNAPTSNLTVTSSGTGYVGTQVNVYGSVQTGGTFVDTAGNTVMAATVTIGGNGSGLDPAFNVYAGNNLSRFLVTAGGNVGIGTTTPSEKLEVLGNAKVSGHFSAATKSFLIPHPTKPSKQLQYACLEGPENGVYIRGKTNESVIILPDYWKELVDEDSVTVTATPIGKFQQLFVASQTSESVEIGNVDGFYNYVIYGERKDVDKLQTEI
jgi:hypothetical protein